jgi:hypothetical protein
MYAEEVGYVVHEACFLVSQSGIGKSLTETQVLDWGGNNENESDDKGVGCRIYERTC